MIESGVGLGIRNGEMSISGRFGVEVDMVGRPELLSLGRVFKFKRGLQRSRFRAQSSWKRFDYLAEQFA